LTSDPRTSREFLRKCEVLTTDYTDGHRSGEETTEHTEIQTTGIGFVLPWFRVFCVFRG
jgi:hypothetical protein